MKRQIHKECGFFGRCRNCPHHRIPITQGLYYHRKNPRSYNLKGEPLFQPIYLEHHDENYFHIVYATYLSGDQTFFNLLSSNIKDNGCWFPL